MIRLQIVSFVIVTLLMATLAPKASGGETDNKQTGNQETKSSQKKRRTIGGKASAPAITRAQPVPPSASPSVDRLLPDGGRTGDPIGGLPGNAPQSGDKAP
jgi:hypothetical protein